MRVVIGDDRLTSDGIRRALDGASGIDIVGEAHAPDEIVAMLELLEPDILLLDPRVPGVAGISFIETVAERCPRVKVVVLSALCEPDHIETVLARGASGYIVKSVDPIDLPSALRQTIAGHVHYASRGLAATSGGGVPDGLTAREIAILRAVARGLSNQAIAKELWVTVQTVKFHLHNVYRKLGVCNRTEAARYVYERGLLESHASKTATSSAS